MMLAVVAQTCNPIPRMREAGKSQVSGQHGLQSKNRVSETTTEFNTANQHCLIFSHGQVPTSA